MVDTVRLRAALIASSADNTIGAWTNQNERDFILSALLGTPTTVSAAGTTQGTATAILTNISVIISGTANQGVGLVGQGLPFQLVLNETAVSQLVYPFSGAAITGGGTALSTNAGFAIAAGSWAGFIATSSTQHYAFFSQF